MPHGPSGFIANKPAGDKTFCWKWDEHGWFLTLKKGLHCTFNRFIFGIPYRCSQVYLKDSLFLYYSGRNGDCNCSTATYSFSYILPPKVAKSLLRFVWDLPAFFKEDLVFRHGAREIMHISSKIRWGLLLVKLTKMSFHPCMAPKDIQVYGKADRFFPQSLGVTGRQLGFHLMIRLL